MMKGPVNGYQQKGYNIGGKIRHHGQDGRWQLLMNQVSWYVRHLKVKYEQRDCNSKYPIAKRGKARDAYGFIGISRHQFPVIGPAFLCRPDHRMYIFFVFFRKAIRRTADDCYPLSTKFSFGKFSRWAFRPVNSIINLILP